MKGVPPTWQRGEACITGTTHGRSLEPAALQEHAPPETENAVRTRNRFRNGSASSTVRASLWPPGRLQRNRQVVYLLHAEDDDGLGGADVDADDDEKHNSDQHNEHLKRRRWSRGTLIRRRNVRRWRMNVLRRRRKRWRKGLFDRAHEEDNENRDDDHEHEEDEEDENQEGGEGVREERMDGGELGDNTNDMQDDRASDKERQQDTQQQEHSTDKGKQQSYDDDDGIT